MVIQEEYTKLEVEYQEIIDWAVKAEKKRTAELKVSGKYVSGLDGQADLYSDITQERDIIIKELKQKYGIK